MTNASQQPQTAPTLTGKSPLLVGLLLTGLLLLGSILRLYDLDDAPFDFHGTRQLHNAIITRGIYYELLPDADPARKEIALQHAGSMPQYEPPLFENIVARTYFVLGREDFAVPRLFASLFWLVGGLFLFDMARRLTGSDGALFGLGFYLLLPFAVQASRSFQPEPLMVMLLVISLYCLSRWAQAPAWKWALPAGMFGGLAVLTKIVAAYLVGGAAVGIVLAAVGFKAALRSRQVWTMVTLMILPSALYYLVDRSGSASEYFSNWTLSLAHLLTDPSLYVRWMSFLHSLIGLPMLIAGLIGVLLAPPRLKAMLLGLWIGYFLYGITLPYQMYTHSYYHLQLIPVIGLSLAPLAGQVGALLAGQNRFSRLLLAGILLVSAAYPAWVARSTLAAEDFRPEISYWEEVSAVLPENEPVIALTQDYGYRLMYYGWRKARLWPTSAEQELARLRGNQIDILARFQELTEGRSYFLVTAMEQYRSQGALRLILEDSYPLLQSGDNYLIYDLRTPLPAAP